LYLIALDVDVDCSLPLKIAFWWVYSLRLLVTFGLY